MNQIVFRTGHWEALRLSLAQRDDVESGAYAVCKLSVTQDCMKLLVHSLVIPNAEDYLDRSAARVSFTPEFSEKAFQACEDFNGHLLDIHTHPWSHRVEFSGIDDCEALNTKIPYMNKYLPITEIGFVVLGKSLSSVRARYWEKSQETLVNVDRIVVI